MSDSLRPYGQQHAGPPCPSLCPGVCLDSCPLSWWCYLTISFSAPTFSFCLQSFPASGSFSSESALPTRWLKYWSFSFSVSPSNEYSGLISFRIDWFDLLTVQWTLRRLLQHQSSKVSILRCSAFFMIQLSHPYITTGKTIPVQFSHSVVSYSFWPRELQHSRPPCPSPTPGVHPNPYPSSWWCHPTILSSVIPFSFPQSFPASGSFQMSQLFASGGQNIGVTTLTSILPMNSQDWSLSGWTGWISLQSKGLSRVFSNTTVQKHQFFSAQLSSQSDSHIHTWRLEKP